VRICVFCGSATGVDQGFAAAARTCGRMLAKRGIELVYGGGRVGLMGLVADAALEVGGKVIGVIPRPLARREIAHGSLTHLHVVPGMHERKAMMASLADAFLTLPGGIGTFEEFFEVLSWSVLGLHQKPMALLNVAGYYTPLVALLHRTIEQGLAHSHAVERILVAETVPDALDSLTLAIAARGRSTPE